MALGAVKLAYTDGGANTALPTVNETVVATLVVGDDSPGGDQIVLEGFAQVTTGAGTTGLQLRVRRGGVAGQQVGPTAQLAAGAAAAACLSIQCADSPGEVASQAYVLTVQQIAATGNGTAVASSLKASY